MCSSDFRFFLRLSCSNKYFDFDEINVARDVRPVLVVLFEYFHRGVSVGWIQYSSRDDDLKWGPFSESFCCLYIVSTLLLRFGRLVP